MTNKIELTGYIMEIYSSNHPKAEDKGKRVVTKIELFTPDGTYYLAAYGKVLIKHIKGLIIGKGSRIHITGTLTDDKVVEVTTFAKLSLPQTRSIDSKELRL